MRAVKRDILVNQRRPPSMQYSDLLAKQSRAIGGACRQDGGNEKKHVKNSLRKVVHGFRT